MQGFMPPHVRQEMGKNYWLDIQGDNSRNDSISLSRPSVDLDFTGVENRRLVNENWADILYHGASQKRKY